MLRTHLYALRVPGLLLASMLVLPVAGCDRLSGDSGKSKDKSADKSEEGKDDDKEDDNGTKGAPAGTHGAKTKKKKGAKGGGGGSLDPAALDGKELVADLGFRPGKDGFSFPNFILSDPSDIPLGPKDLQRMCGSKAVCAGGKSSDSCTLRAGAQAFLDSAGKMLGGGHCEGFSVGSLRLFTKDDDVSKLGGETTFGLDKAKKTERYLAYWAVSQASPSVAKATIRTTPSKTLDKIIAALKKGTDPYLLGIYKSDGTGGHAIVPYAVEDKNDDKFWVYVYENNSPNTLRHLEFDKGKNTWRYDDAQINPSEAASTYEGDADLPRLELVPQSSRKSMACPFAPGSKPDKPEPEEDKDEVAEGDDDVMVVGRGASKLALEDGEGHTLGVKDGKLVSEIPGGTYVIVRGKLNSNHPPILIVPAKVKVKLHMRGTVGQKDDVAIIGRRFAATFTGVELGAGAKEHVEIDGKMKHLSFVGGQPNATKIVLYMDKGAAVQQLEVPKMVVAAGGSLQLDFFKGSCHHLDGKGGSKPVIMGAIPVTKLAEPPKGGGSIEDVTPLAPPKPKIGGADDPAVPGKPTIGGAEGAPTAGKPTIGGAEGAPTAGKPTIGGAAPTNAPTGPVGAPPPKPNIGGAPTAAPPPPPPANTGKKPKLGGS